jgi:type I restriction enzyme, S subunit
MDAEQLLEHFDRVAEAPGSIAALRRFILDLAVRGKLVDQDPNDEPASELLKQIQSEKRRLIKEGKLKTDKDKSLLGITKYKEPYDIPVNWKWVKLSETINNHLGGGTPSKNNRDYWDGDIYWASVKDIGKQKYLDKTIDRITELGLANSTSNLIPSGNLIVVTRMGLGKIAINHIPVAINQDLRALFLSDLISVEYHYIFFKTHGFEGSGVTVKGIKVDELISIDFPLPPLAEQHRIVSVRGVNEN